MPPSLPMSPLDWPGTPFLILYLVLLAVAALFSALAPVVLRPDGRAQAVTDPAWLARLAGGRARWLDATVAGRLASGELVLAGRRFAAAGGADRSWRQLARDLAAPAARAERELRAAGLLASAGDARTLGRWAAGPFVVLAAFGALKLAVGLLRDRPVGLLAVLLVVTVIAAVIRATTVDRRTRAGRDVVRHACAAHDRLRCAATRPEMALGVALFGTGVLAASEHEPFHRLRHASGEGSVDVDGGDGGGCGGGGCGGCGS